MEERLYWLLADKGITYITISHRYQLRFSNNACVCLRLTKWLPIVDQPETIPVPQACAAFVSP